MRLQILVLLVVAAVCSSPLVNNVGAQQNLDLVLIASLDRQGVYHQGETINLTIFSYLGETPIDLNEIYINLTDIYGGNLLALYPVKNSTGRYLVQYTLKPDDTEKRFVITGNASGIKKNLYVSIPFEPPTRIYISFPDTNFTSIAPGKNLKFYVECYQNYTLIAPESIVAFLEYEENQKILNLSKENDWRFSGNFTIPTLNHSATFKITVTARINGKIETTSLSIEYIPMSVWYKSVNITETTASFALGICDKNGSSVVNASITLRYTTDFGGEKKIIQGRTNSEGVAYFHIMPDFIVSPYIYVWGEAIANETKTEFQFSIPLITQQHPSSGLDIIVHNSTYINGKLKIDGTAYCDKKPFNNSKIFYFLKNWGEIHGNFTTDMNGNFNVEITSIEERYIHPYFGVTLSFVAAENSTLRTDKGIWLNLPIDLWLDAAITLDHRNVEFGKTLELTLHRKNTFLTNMLYPPFAYICNGDVKFTEEFYTTWSPIVASAYFLPVNTTSMRCILPLPSFFYEGQKNITLAAIYYEAGTFVPHMTIKRFSLAPDIRANFSVILTGEDYIVVNWEKYEGESFVKYEILVEGEGGWISIANITDKSITEYRITAVNGNPLKGGREYRIKLKIYFDTSYIEEVVSASTQPKVPGFTIIDIFTSLAIIGICICIVAKLRGKRRN